MPLLDAGLPPGYGSYGNNATLRVLVVLGFRSAHFLVGVDTSVVHVGVVEQDKLIDKVDHDEKSHDADQNDKGLKAAYVPELQRVDDYSRDALNRYLCIVHHVQCFGLILVMGLREHARVWHVVQTP
mmetsp:Transcript_24303/g.47599  ORF Transcript_24303/g.47599 Transcript_24303/m.47599 type:complete len:127 (+) Transcript_24303:68-448(+)